MGKVSLKDKTLNSLLWSFIDSYGVYFLRFGFSIGIARYVMPEEFGLIGMLSLFIGLALLFTEGGFGAALIQKKDADDEDFSTAYIFNLVVGLLMYGMLYFSSPFISRFYNQPSLILIIKIVGLQILFNDFGYIFYIKLIKSLNYKKIAKLNAISSISGGIVGLVMAVFGYGVWAIVIQILATSLIKTLMLWYLSDWTPVFKFSVPSFKKQFQFGYKIFIQGLLDVVFNNIYGLLIGKYYTSASLGFYSRGKRFHSMFVEQLALSFKKVFFPLLSSINNEKIKMKKEYNKIYQLIFFFIVPTMVFLILIMESFVLFFLTETWLPSVRYINLFFIEGFILPLYFLNLDVIDATGSSGITLKINTFKKSIIIVVLIITVQINIEVMLYGWLLCSLLALIFSEHVLFKMKFNSFEKIRNLFPVGVFCIVIYAIGFYIQMLRFHPLVMMLILGLLTFSIYFFLMRIFQPKVYTIFKSIISEYLPKNILKLL